MYETVSLISQHRNLGSVPEMMIKFFWIMKIDPLQSRGKAFLLCPQDKKEKFLVSASWTDSQPTLGAQKEVDF